MGFPHPRLMHRFSSNFQDLFTQEVLELIRFWAAFSNDYCHGNTFMFLVLNFVGITQPKSRHEFSRKFQDIFNTRRSGDDLILWSIWQWLLPPMQICIHWKDNSPKPVNHRLTLKEGKRSNLTTSEDS